MSHWIQRALAAGAVTLLLAAAPTARASDFVITLTDLTTGQPFSLPVFLTHDSSLSLCKAGQTASFGIQQIAEAGDRAPLVSTLTPLLGSSVYSIATPLSSPLPAGQSVTFFLRTDATHTLLSSAWMLGRTNDTFAGQNALDLASFTGTRTFDISALDAGTEVNTELEGDLIAFGGSGRTAENGVVHAGEGIRGIDHFVNGLGYDANNVRTDAPADWRYGSPVARVTITAVPEPGSLALLFGMATTGTGLLLKRRRIARR